MIILFFRLYLGGNYWCLKILISYKDTLKKSFELRTIKWLWARNFDLKLVFVGSYTNKPN